MLKWKQVSNDWEARASKIFIVLRPPQVINHNVYSGDIFIVDTFLCVPIPPFSADNIVKAQEWVNENFQSVLIQAAKNITAVLEDI